MKLQLTILSLLIVISGIGQTTRDSVGKAFRLGYLRSGTGSPHTQGIIIDSTTSSDTLTAERLIEDSLGNHYMVEYRYAEVEEYYKTDTVFEKITMGKYQVEPSHSHYIALVNIIKYNGNRQTTIAKNIKAIYSPTECSADNVTIWKQKINEYLKQKR